MNLSAFSAFISLAALLVAASILSVGSITMTHSLANELFKPSHPNSRLFWYTSDISQKTRDQITILPHEIWVFYVLCFSIIFLIFFGNVLIVHEIDGSIEKVLEIIPISIVNFAIKYQIYRVLLGLGLAFYACFSGYVVMQTLNIARVCFHERNL